MIRRPRPGTRPLRDATCRRTACRPVPGARAVASPSSGRRDPTARSIVAALLLACCSHDVAARRAALPPLATMPRPASTGRVATGGASIWYAAYGAGPPVVLLHGGLASSDYWAAEIPTLARHHRVIAIDSRGHGRSTGAGRPLSYEAMADDVVAVLDRLRVRRADVAGWSDGGIVALVMGMRHPSRVRDLVALAANMDPTGVLPDDPRSPRFAAYVRRAAEEYGARSSTPGSFEALRTSVEEMWLTQPNYSAADLARIAAPTTILIGAEDEAISLAHSRYLARTIPGARLVVVPDVGHFALLQAPTAMAQAVRRALARRALTRLRGCEARGRASSG